MPVKEGPLFLLRNLIRGNILHNWAGAFRVMRLLTVHKMPAGLLTPDHPWITGIDAGTAKSIWPQNIAYRTKPGIDGADADDEVVSKVGRFLAAMVHKSVVMPEIPHGPKRRMPHAVNYLHGSVHFNGVTLLFNDFSEAKNHVADPEFRAELRRMIAAEKREVTFVFRQRDYDPVAFAYFSSFVMTHFPWFANTNGSRRRIMWGNASPYPALNIINGAWYDDISVLRKGDVHQIIRQPLKAGIYFPGEYGVPARAYHFIERMHAYLINGWVRRRGFKAGLYFVDRRVIEPRQYEAYLAAKGKVEPVNAPIPNPIREKMRGKRR